MNIFIALFFGALLAIGLGGGFLLWSGQMARDAEASDSDVEVGPATAPRPPTLAPIPDPRPLPGPGTR